MAKEAIVGIAAGPARDWQSGGFRRPLARVARRPLTLFSDPTSAFCRTVGTS